MICSVQVVNAILPSSTTSPATVNQCNGSGAGGGTQPTVSCSPVGSTTNATVTQCNSSGNGGGASMRVQCTVDPSTQAAAVPVTINGGGTSTGDTSLASTGLALGQLLGAAFLLIGAGLLFMVAENRHRRSRV